MITEAPETLTGIWLGRYLYASGWLPETPFSLDLIETNGTFEGSSDEPNVAGLNSDAVVTATVRGRRDGRRVSFVKQMDGSGGISHAIGYEGELSADGVRVTGAWHIDEHNTGTFVMERAANENGAGRP